MQQSVAGISGTGGEIYTRGTTQSGRDREAKISCNPILPHNCIGWVQVCHKKVRSSYELDAFSRSSLDLSSVLFHEMGKRSSLLKL